MRKSLITLIVLLSIGIILFLSFLLGGVDKDIRYEKERFVQRENKQIIDKNFYISSKENIVIPKNEKNDGTDEVIEGNCFDSDSEGNPLVSGVCINNWGIEFKDKCFAEDYISHQYECERIRGYLTGECVRDGGINLCEFGCQGADDIYSSEEGGFCLNESDQNKTEELNETAEDTPMEDEKLQIEMLFEKTYITEIEINPDNENKLFAITNSPCYEQECSRGELYKSEDGGITWNLVKRDITLLEMDKINSDIVYAAYWNKLFRSADGGETFVLLHEFPYIIGSIFTDRFVSDKIYVTDRPIPISEEWGAWGYYVLENNGLEIDFISFRDFIGITPEYGEATIGRIVWAINQDVQDPNVIYFTGEDSDHSVYGPPTGPAEDWDLWPDPYMTIRTLDGGLSFEAISEGLSWHSISIEPLIDSFGVTQWRSGTEGNGVYKLQENVWKIISDTDGLIVFKYLVNPMKEEEHFIAAKRLIKISDDYGNSWEDFYLDEEAMFTDIEINSKGEIYFSDYNGGIYIAR
ncbi:hypothetical protein HY450_01430 [Candidatus Pacearchaeota archaeon]|nr:hypothetical protein [Candidatus Pacearchaeota archaeon]